MYLRYILFSLKFSFFDDFFLNKQKTFVFLHLTTFMTLKKSSKLLVYIT